MKIKLVTGATAYEAAKNTLSQIDTQNRDYKNLVVVPDAFSMQAESLIFDTLKIKSTFNIEVVGISRLASKLLRDNGIAFTRISGLEEVFSLYKAVQDCKDEFRYFKNANVEFCMKMLQIIKQFKGCKVTPDKIGQTGDEALDKKMGDIRSIYKKYEEIISDKMDLSKLLDYFIEKTNTEIDLSKTNLFFINFDSFSAEIGEFLCQVASKAHQTFVGMAKAISPNNAFIYENDIMSKISKYSKENQIAVDVETFPTKLDGERREIVENLFGFKIKAGKSDYFSNIIAKNRQDEAEFVAKYIKYQVTKGKKFKDFAIAISDDGYYELLKSTFNDFGICAYCDDAVDLSRTIIGRFGIKILEIAKKGFSKSSFEYLSQSEILGRDEQALKDISIYNIEEDEEFIEKFPKYKNVVELITALGRQSHLSGYTEVLKDILSSVEEKYHIFLQKLEKMPKKQSENEQSFELLYEVLNKLQEIAGSEPFELYDFEEMLLFAMRNVKVETIPTYIDAVYVGQATESYFEDVDTLFVLGANSGALPSMQNDTGIIDDDDIMKLRLSFLLEPEIKVLNRRKRLKLFEVLQHAKNRLIVCVPLNSGNGKGEPADFVNDLSILFGKNVFHTKALEFFEGEDFSPEQNLEKFLMLVGHKNNLLPVYAKLKEKMSPAMRTMIEGIALEEMPQSTKSEYLKFSQEKETISASELESYFHCPYRHLLQYELKLQEKKDISPQKLDFGNFEHDLLETFVNANENIQLLTERDIEKFLHENLLKIAGRYYDKKVLTSTFQRYLQNETKIILENVVKEQKHSSFRPSKTEEKICQPLGENLKLVGKVDRVDVCGDYFRIIDYKTGETGSIKNELFYGKKLQLFLYANAVERKTSKICAGVYYFDCRSKYSKQNSSQKILKGLTLKNEDVAFYTDSHLADNDKSEISNINRKKNLKEGDFPFRGSFEENFSELFDYAKKISLIANDEIKSGYVAKKPFGDICATCPYISICGHRNGDGYRTYIKTKSKVEDGT